MMTWCVMINELKIKDHTLGSASNKFLRSKEGNAKLDVMIDKANAKTKELLQQKELETENVKNE